MADDPAIRMAPEMKTAPFWRTGGCSDRHQDNDMKIRFRSIGLFLLFLSMAVCAFFPPASAQAPDDGPVAQNTSGRSVSIDFNNVDINLFIKFISELTGTNFIVDDRVKGKVTIISPSKISIEEAYKVFESVLEVHGFATVPAGEVTKIVPSPDARTKSIETRIRQDARSPGDEVVTQIIPLTYADPEEIKKLFTPMVSKSAVLLSYAPTNTLIITDVHSNIRRLMRILSVIDVTDVGRELTVLPLEFANAEKLIKILESVFQEKQPRAQKGAAAEGVRLVADARTNTLIFLASREDTRRIKELVVLLDKEAPRGTGTIHVVYLENATAEDLATVLQEVPKKAAGGNEQGKKGFVVSENVRITADKATNSLIIVAEEEDFLTLQTIIEQLDIPRSMVYIECLIMEVNLDKDFRLGTEWIAMDDTTYDNRSLGYGGGFSGGSESGFSNLGGVTGDGAGSLPLGFSLGVFGEAIKVGSVTFPNLAAVVQAFKKDKDVHILSTPQILTTDNEEASIYVGRNIPYLTKSGSSTVESYNTFEYKDVGITLKITPHISKDKQVRLKIAQEVSKLDELLTTSEDQPTTLKRTIDTTVIVNDKNTVVIGGLIDDSFSLTEYQVPCLGSMPGLGWLFKSRSHSRERTNLFVFLTPKVIANPAEAQAVYEEKKEAIDKVKASNIKLYNEPGSDAAGPDGGQGGPSDVRK